MSTIKIIDLYRAQTRCVVGSVCYMQYGPIGYLMYGWEFTNPDGEEHILELA